MKSGKWQKITPHCKIKVSGIVYGVDEKVIAKIQEITFRRTGGEKNSMIKQE